MAIDALVVEVDGLRTCHNLMEGEISRTDLGVVLGKNIDIIQNQRNELLFVGH